MDTNADAITLRGRVRSRAERIAIEQCAHSAWEVRELRNDLSVEYVQVPPA